MTNVADGKPYLLQTIKTPMFDADGALIGVLGIARDITPLHETQAALRESEARYRALFETMVQGVVYQDAEGRIIAANPAAERILGLSLEEMKGLTSLDPCWQPIHEDGSPFPGEEHPAMVALRTGRPVQDVVQGVYNPRTESHVWICIHAVPLFRLGEPTPFEVHTTFEDINARKLQEEELERYRQHIEDLVEERTRALQEANRLLEQSSSRLKLATGSAGIGVWERDAEHDRLIWDDQMCALYGITPAAFSGTRATWIERLHPDDRARAMAETERTLRGEGDYDTEFRIVWPDGSVRHIAAFAQVERDRAGRPLRVLGVNWDITARKRIEAELEQARAAAEAASRAKSTFLATMSHEIRTPMNAIIGLTHLLRRGASDPRQREQLTRVADAAQHLLAIINDILDISKIEAGKLELEAIDFDLRTLVEDVVELLAEPAERKGLVLSCLVDHALPARLHGDPGRLRQVLTNLVGNAVKFTERGEILIRADAAEHDADSTLLHISVVDSGVGIAEQTVSQLFQPFMQADASTTRLYGGTGLGLAISRQLATMMGGSLTVQSTLGQGSVFRLTLHLAPALSPEPQPEADHHLHGKRVLVVDGTPSIRALLLHLMQAWDIKATATASATEALTDLHSAVDRAQPYDPALIDASIHDHQGLDLARTIRADARIAACAPILMTAYTQRRDSSRAREIGAAAVLAEPIRQSQLFDALATALDGDTAPGEVSPPAADQRRPPPEPQERSAGRVLVVEDNQVNQKVAARMLEKLGYAADVVANGREALDALSQIPYRLVLMDCHMPEMDGFAATAAIRAREGSARHTPIVALTANALAGERERCLAAGMDDYLAKPIQKAELAAALARWLAGGSAPATAPAGPNLDKHSR